MLSESYDCAVFAEKIPAGSVITVRGVVHRCAVICGGRAERHKHDGDDWSVTATSLEAYLTSVRLQTARQHRVSLATFQDHVAQVLLHAQHAFLVTLRTISLDATPNGVTRGRRTAPGLHHPGGDTRIKLIFCG